jgi:hypothetical protein
MLRCAIQFALITTMLSLPLSALAQDDTATTQRGFQTPATSGSDRLFLAFIEDAAVVPNQWWEGQLEYIDGSVDGLAVDAFLLRGVVAFQPWDRWELGARLALGSTDTPSGLPDGRGATDLDLWGKYYLGRTSERTEFSAGGVLVIPTGDDSAGLGTDAFAFTAFGAMRQRFQGFILSFNIGAQFNQDGQIFRDFQLEGKTAPIVGAGVIIPSSDRISWVGEFRYWGERFDGADSDTRLLGGINWRVQNRGMFRGAIGVGLSDGAPDFQITAGYAFNF